MSSPRVRFAPAPTGFLHVGSARTALFNWLFARHHGGEMVLRVEDTDAALKTQEYVDAIIEPLRWLGLDWDSGPHFQSDRRDRHSEAIERLVDGGAAYYCDLTRAEIEERCAAAGLPAGYHGWSRDRDVADGPGVVVRFRCPDDGTTVVDDIVRGRVSFPNESLEDFVIRRGDGSPTFHLANAVDDHDMGITHVVRGEDLLNTTPRVQLIWQALGFGALPHYAHLPLLVNAKRQKLSKRRDDVALDNYRRRGYLPEAMVNYLALLGWGPPDEVEIRPLDEIVELFDLDAVKPAPAFFDPARLDHINSAYISEFTPEQFAARAEPFLTGPDAPWPAECYDRATVEALAAEIQQRIAHLDEAAGWIDWILCPDVTYDEKAWHKSIVKGRAAAEVLEAVEAQLTDDDFTSAERLEAIVMGVGDELTESLGQRVRSQPPVRVALTGTGSGLPLWEPMRLLGKDQTLSRLRKAMSRL
ncbi:MAG: glutamate--tRNA ligase [Acidimicrobiaceae bacterium]|nr:glutamate--tRNA ligase [Acidimicrobiaceae bacterium]MXY09365.1 glutamate--tRNA ligase [Acidimicrobiaceae bacterium]MXZ66706.1 glutamate--tRNA ligase [Acidimicrobiaceae bacterium]MYE64755.1 glutamate--tRNA ligase [Acidimicrobiaceae bacterium]MYF33278.1 glutamate--tRNA ligase [Acidimicrobiaceae bacterium]